MILAINIFLGIQLLTVIVAEIMGGSTSFSWNTGILFGVNAGSTYIKARDKKDEDAEDAIYQLFVIQYHFLCASAHITLLRKRPDLKEEEMDFDEQMYQKVVIPLLGFKEIVAYICTNSYYSVRTGIKSAATDQHISEGYR